MAPPATVETPVWHHPRRLREPPEVDRSGLIEGGVWCLTLLPPAALTAAVALQPWVHPADLLRDPLAVAEMSDACCKVYFGAISHVGVLVWTSAAAICAFAAGVLMVSSGRSDQVVFMIVAALLTGLLALDDLFLIHENVLPALGIAQPVTYAGYGLLAAAYLALSWRRILQNDYPLLSVALALLATSVAIDWLIHSDQPIRIVLEDGAKLCGIFAWSSFHVAAAWRAIAQQPASPSRSKSSVT